MSSSHEMAEQIEQEGRRRWQQREAEMRKNDPAYAALVQRREAAAEHAEKHREGIEAALRQLRGE